MNPILILWHEEAGFIISAELVLISTIAVLAMIVGLADVSLTMNQELQEVAAGNGIMHQSFRYQGLTGHNTINNGSSLQDPTDFCGSITSSAPMSGTGTSIGPNGSW